MGGAVLAGKSHRIIASCPVRAGTTGDAMTVEEGRQPVGLAPGVDAFRTADTPFRDTYLATPAPAGTVLAAHRRRVLS